MFRELKEVTVDDYPWPRLAPLPEARVAAMTLGSLDGIFTEFLPGWAPAGLALTTFIWSRRPGSTIRMKQTVGALRYSITGGTLTTTIDVTGPPTSTWVNALAQHTCEVCGRPGMYRHGPLGAFCDACFYLRTHPAEELPFAPRLPLLDLFDATAETNRGLTADEAPAGIPAGWARLAVSTLRELGSVAPDVDVEFHDRGTNLTMHATAGRTDRLEFMTGRLEGSSRVRCRDCGRNVDHSSDHVGRCDGCHWVQSRGWWVVPAWGDDRMPHD